MTPVNGTNVEGRVAASARQPYIRDVEFPSSYVAGQAPIHMGCAAALRGFSPPKPSGEYGYCELGCSSGATLNPLAAANPQARFFGVDFNAEHIRKARSTAKSASLDNVTYVEASFEDLTAHDLPIFDFISMHGTYSWLSPAAESAAVRFVTQHLKPGGLFYVDYMSLPGKAAIAPLWMLMRSLTRGHPGNSAQRTRDGLHTLERLIDEGSRFFEANPPAAMVLEATLKRIEQDPDHLNAVAHHALSEHWSPKYFTDVAAQLDEAGLRFAGSTRLAHNDLDLVVPPSLRSFFEELDDPNLVELLKDYVLNQQQRQDVFIKDARADAAGAEAFLRSDVFVLARGEPSTVRQKMSKGGGSLGGIEDELLDTLLQQVERGSSCLDEIERGPELQSFEPRQVLKAFETLLATDAFFICARRPPDDTPADASAAATRGLTSPLTLNRVILRQAAGKGQPALLTSPVVGGGCVALNAVEVALIDALVDVGPAKVFQRAKRRLRTHKRSIQFHGSNVRLDQIDLSGLQDILRQMLHAKLGLLARLSLVKIK